MKFLPTGFKLKAEKFFHPWHLRLAKKIIQGGGLVAYPTEAVFGLGCHPLDVAAVFRLLTLKQRPIHKGLILIADSVDALYPFLGEIPQSAWERMAQSWPGPTTWVVPAAKATPKWLTGQHRSIAVRVTDHPLAAALCRISATPLVSTSANLSRQSPAKSALEVYLRCGHGVDLVLHGRTGGLSKPTVIRDALSGEVIRA
jgi:L-threonylcarbamoyladenylate synthase